MTRVQSHANGRDDAGLHVRHVEAAGHEPAAQLRRGERVDRQLPRHPGRQPVHRHAVDDGDGAVHLALARRGSP